jgi:hypothetical protein
MACHFFEASTLLWEIQKWGNIKRVFVIVKSQKAPVQALSFTTQKSKIVHNNMGDLFDELPGRKISF